MPEDFLDLNSSGDELGEAYRMPAMGLNWLTLEDIIFEFWKYFW